MDVYLSTAKAPEYETAPKRSMLGLKKDKKQDNLKLKPLFLSRIVVVATKST